MACLGAVLYDPGTAVNKVTTSLLAMTALDTTNARITFTAPANGMVLVRIRGVVHGASTAPMLLLGVLDGATVRGRQVPACLGRVNNSAQAHNGVESLFLVTGLTPSTSYTFDAAYAVQVVVASTGFKYGGPDNTTTNDAFGALSFEVWETEQLLAATMYDPAAAVSKATSALLAMTALDTTNLRLAFTTTASGPGSTRVLVRLRGGAIVGATTNPYIFLGVLDGAAITGRVNAMTGSPYLAAALATTHLSCEVEFVVPGLTPSTAYTWDAAYGVDFVVAATNLKYGGPDNTTGDNAWGGFSFEVWKA